MHFRTWGRSFRTGGDRPIDLPVFAFAHCAAVISRDRLTERVEGSFPRGWRGKRRSTPTVTAVIRVQEVPTEKGKVSLHVQILQLCGGTLGHQSPGITRAH